MRITRGEAVCRGMLALCILPLIGCSSMRTAADKISEWTITDPPLPTRAFAGGMQFDDLPVPAGYTLLVTRSFAHKHGRLRIASLEYTGSVGIEPTVKFMQTQWPLQGWKMDSMSGVGNQREILFIKGRDACTATMKTEKSVTTLVLRVDYR